MLQLGKGQQKQNPIQILLQLNST